MNEFPVCVFAFRAVDCVNLFNFNWIYVWTTTTWVGTLLFNCCFNANTSLQPPMWSSEPGPEVILYKYSTKLGMPHNSRLASWVTVYPERELKSPSMHTGPWAGLPGLCDKTSPMANKTSTKTSPISELKICPCQTIYTAFKVHVQYRW